MPRTKRARKERQYCPSSCIACGDAATGYHYDAPSCIPCKTFFRRTVLEERVLNGCAKAGMCEKNKLIKPCRFCRLNRCVEGGMNPLLILNLENPASNSVVKKVLQKRAIDYSEVPTSSSSSDSSPKILLNRSSPSAAEYEMDRLIGGLVHLEKAHRCLRESSFSPSLKDGYRLEKCNFDTGYNPMTSTPGATKFWPFADLFLSIEYMKTFEFFHFLSHEDKKALARHVSVMCSHLTLAYFSFENKSDVTYHPDGTIPHSGRVDTRSKTRDIAPSRNNRDPTNTRFRQERIRTPQGTHCLQSSDRRSFMFTHNLAGKCKIEILRIADILRDGPGVFAAIMAIVDTLSHLMKSHKNWFVLRQASNHKLGSKETPNLLTDNHCH